MDNLIKIRDVSSLYNVTARTLRYYEDIGLITSARSEDYAHRLYDEAAITRLKQILILRKLNISILNIKRIFNATGSEIVLEVLGKKAEEIDDEMALLHELREIVLDFIRQIQQIDFRNDADVKKLYDKAKTVETHLNAAQLTASDNNENLLPDETGNPDSNVKRLLSVTEKLDNTRRITMPAIIKAYRQKGKAMRFIGKRYSNEDRVDGMFGAKWKEWFENGWFELLQTQLRDNLLFVEDDMASCIGLMRDKGGNHDDFEYWIGYFALENTVVPNGFEYEDLPAMDIGVCWIYGREDEVFGIEPEALAKLQEEGFEMITEWCFERYSPTHYGPDKKGDVILDICFFIK